MGNDDNGDRFDERLARGYDGLMKRARELLSEAEKTRLPTLDELLERATDTVVEVGDLTRIEVQRVATWLKDDLSDAAEHMRQNGQELRDWLRFDIDLLETRLRDRLEVLVDHNDEVNRRDRP